MPEILQWRIRLGLDAPKKTMKNIPKLFLSGVVVLGMFAANLSLRASPNKTEAELIQMLYSGDYHKINDALDRLPHWYPNSTNAIPVIKQMLRSNETMIVTRPAPQSLSKKVAANDGHLMPIRMPPDIMARMAARALGNYHAAVDGDDLDLICNLLKSSDVETVMDGLKALRGLDTPQAVPDILPLLQSQNDHVLRDACRTLAVLGNKSTIPYIEPLLKNPRIDVKADAQTAITSLRSKP